MKQMLRYLIKDQQVDRKTQTNKTQICECTNIHMHTNTSPDLATTFFNCESTHTHIHMNLHIHARTDRHIH